MPESSGSRKVFRAHPSGAQRMWRPSNSRSLPARFMVPLVAAVVLVVGPLIWSTSISIVDKGRAQVVYRAKNIREAVQSAADVRGDGRELAAVVSSLAASRNVSVLTVFSQDRLQAVAGDRDQALQWAVAHMYPLGVRAASHGERAGFLEDSDVFYAEWPISLGDGGKKGVLFVVIDGGRAMAAERAGAMRWATMIALTSIILLFLVQRQLKALVLQPARDIEAAVERRASGDAAVRCRVRSNDEMGRLGDAINDMLVSLQEHETALSRSEALFRAMCDSSPLGVFFTDADGRIAYTNPAVEEMWDVAGEAVLHKTWVRIIEKDDRARVMAEWQHAFKARESVTLFHCVRHGDGSTRHVTTKAAPIVDGGSFQGYVGTVADITELKAAQEALRSQLHMMDALMNAIPACVYYMDTDARFFGCNQAFADFVGVRREEIAGKTVFDAVDPASAAACQEKDAELLRTRGTQEYEMELPNARGERRHVLMNRATFTDGQGRPAGLVCVFLDITDRRATEKQIAKANGDLQEALDRAKELAEASEAASAAKSAFLANVGHEIRTPINGIVGMVDLLLETPLDEGQKECAETVRDCSMALLGVISDILDFSNADAGTLRLEHEGFRLSAMLDEIEALLRPDVLAKHLDFSVQIVADTPNEWAGDATRIRQILLNIAGNAVKFTETGSISIEASCLTTDSAPAGLRFVVSDTGIGIPEAVLPGIFESFTQADPTSTRRYGGTGLGLSICRRLAQLMGGDIGVESREGLGSTFWVEIPLETTDLRTDTDGDVDELDRGSERWVASKAWVDPDVLRTICDGDEETVAEIYGAFETLAGELVDEAAKHAKARKWSEVAMLAHTLRGSAANVGAAGLSELCERLESASAAKSPEAGDLLAEVRSVVAYMLRRQRRAA